MKFKKFFFHNWPIFAIFFLVFIFFWQFFLKGLLPIPSDIIVGLYFPWLDYKWGTITGVPVKNPLLSDIPSILYPWRSLVIDQFKSFKIPTWNPYYFLGMPLMANFQSAAFSLANIFFLFLKKPLAWSWGVIFQPIMAMVFTYVFLRNKKLSKFSCLFGGLAFAFCGFNQAWLEYNVHGWTAAFLPLLLFLVDKVFETKKKIYGYLFSAAVAFQIFSGYQPVVIYSGIILFFYILIFYLSRNFKNNFKALRILINSVLLGFFLSAVQLIPGYELTKLSVRKVDPVAKLSSGGFFPLENFITFLAPDFFGNPAAYNYWGKPFYDNFFGFVGIPVLFLALTVFSFNFKKKKENFFWSLLLVLSLVMITKNPFSLFLEKVNFLGLKGGIWAKGLFITDFSLAVLAAFGFEQLVEFQLKRKKFFLVAIFLVFCLGICWLLAFGMLKPPFIVSSFLPVARRNLILPSVFLGASAFCLFLNLFFKSRAGSLISCMAIFLLSFFSLFYQFNKYVPFSRKEFLFPETPVISFLKNQKGVFRIEPTDVLPQNFWMMYGLEAASGYDALLPLNTGRFLAAVETGKIQDSVSRVHLLTNFNSPLFKLLSVRFFLVKKQDGQGRFTPEGKYPDYFLKGPRYKLVFEDKTVGIFEDLKYLPRAWMIGNFVIEKDPEKIIKTLQGSEFDPLREVVLEEQPEVNFDWENERNGEESVDFGITENTRRSYVVKTEKGGILFESAAFFPGWKAYIDGRQTKIFKANLAFRAVIVPPGVHEVRLYYEPKSFLIGMIMSFTSFIYLFFKLLEWRPSKE